LLCTADDDGRRLAAASVKSLFTLSTEPLPAELLDLVIEQLQRERESRVAASLEQHLVDF